MTYSALFSVPDNLAINVHLISLGIPYEIINNSWWVVWGPGDVYICRDNSYGYSYGARGTKEDVTSFFFATGICSIMEIC